MDRRDGGAGLVGGERHFDGEPASHRVIASRTIGTCFLVEPITLQAEVFWIAAFSSSIVAAADTSFTALFTWRSALLE